MKLQVDVDLTGVDELREKYDKVYACTHALEDAIIDLKHAVCDVKAKISQPTADTID